MTRKYVPPQLRGANVESRGRDTGNFDQPDEHGSGITRHDDSHWNGDRRGNGKGNRGRHWNDGINDYGSGNYTRSAPTAMEGSGGDWTKRHDGRWKNAEEPSEIEVFGERSRQSTAGIDFDNYDKIPAQLSGSNAADYSPITRFSEAKLTDSLFENLRRCGYDRPTPVQKYAIPVVLRNRDIMACAQTGSGKTCAFMVPCLESLLRSGPPPPLPGGGGRRFTALPCGLVLAPTRELAQQIHGESRKFSYRTGIRCCIIYGGADIRDQRAEIQRGCDVLIATPGRLHDMYERGYVSLSLTQFFILDEADRMLDMGFEPQVREIVDQTDIGRHSKFARQSMMFSATFAVDVQHMARDFLNDYVFLTIGRVGSASELVAQKVVFAEDPVQKLRSLDRALQEYRPKDGLAIVFVETKRGADSLERELYERMPVTAIHGDRTQTEREEALAAFKSGANPVMIATDVAARGLDIPNVSLVVNYDMPKHLDDYVHRIGRTGRAGRKGVAVAFVHQHCTYLQDLSNLLKESKQDPPLWFEDLARQTRRGPSGRVRIRDGPDFGGRDYREFKDDGVTPRPPTQAHANKSSTFSQTQRPQSSWGNTGQEDAW